MRIASILVGRAEDRLAELEPASVHCAVTSPPYWGLRDYRADGQLGQEPTPEAYVESLVGILRGVRRVLRPDGTLWLNLGDCYATGAGAGKIAGGGKQGEAWGERGAWQANRMKLEGLKRGAMVGIPWRVAFALQADGWLLRKDIIWHKPNPMPESVSGWRWERCRVKVAPQPKRAPESEQTAVQYDRDCPYGGIVNAPRATWADCPGCDKCSATDGLVLRRGSWRPTRSHEHVFLFAAGPDYFCDGEGAREDSGANLRDVWTLATQPFGGEHFATFPPALPELCIKAGTSRSVCSSCGAPRAPVVGFAAASGYRPTCDCSAGETPALVLDPFCGAGTTGVIALSLGRGFVGVEVNGDYARMAQRRIIDTAPLLNQCEVHP